MIIRMESANKDEIRKVVGKIKEQGFDALLANGGTKIVIAVLGLGVESFNASEIKDMPKVTGVRRTKRPLGKKSGKFREWQYFHTVAEEKE